jgi:hypothetical protein
LLHKEVTELLASSTGSGVPGEIGVPGDDKTGVPGDNDKIGVPGDDDKIGDPGDDENNGVRGDDATNSPRSIILASKFKALRTRGSCENNQSQKSTVILLRSSKRRDLYSRAPLGTLLSPTGTWVIEGSLRAGFISLSWKS